MYAPISPSNYVDDMDCYTFDVEDDPLEVEDALFSPFEEHPHDENNSRPPFSMDEGEDDDDEDKDEGPLDLIEGLNIMT